MKPGFAPALALLLLAAPAPARDLFVDNLAGYTIAAKVLDAPGCTGAAFSDVTLESFERALCVFHRPLRKPEDSAQAVSLMTAAQTRGLPPVHQQLATLVSGLANCAEAERHLAAFRASDQKNELERTLFCRDRRAALADLNAIRWNHALFDYAPGLPASRSLSARLGEMSACHAGALDPGLDAECGLITNPTMTEINAFVDAAVGVTITTYFTGVESPITAMFARKTERAEGLLVSAEAGIAGLESTAAGVNAEYDVLNAAYAAARDSRMTPIYDAYRDAILRATSILDEFDRWKGGLFLTAENINLLPKIAERSVDLDEELARVQDLAFRDKAASLVADIRRLVDGKAEDRAAVAQLCRIYFCELTSRRALPGVIRACRRPALADNPLCIGGNGQIASGVVTADFDGPQTADLVQMCQDAGLDPAFTVVDLTPNSAAACLVGMP